MRMTAAMTAYRRLKTSDIPAMIGLWKKSGLPIREKTRRQAWISGSSDSVRPSRRARAVARNGAAMTAVSTSDEKPSTRMTPATSSG